MNENEVEQALKSKTTPRPLIAAAVDELVDASRDLVNFVRKNDPPRMKKPGWLRLQNAVATMERVKAGDLDIEAALSDVVSPARNTDPSTSQRATEIASMQAGKAKHQLGEVYYDHPEGLTSEEAVVLAELTHQRSPWHRVSDLAQAGVLVENGQERETSAGAMARVLVMTEQGRAEWKEHFR